MNKLIILDRDGVINEDSDNYIKNADEWIPIAGSLQAIARLNHAGYIVAVASNQSGLSRGYFSYQDLNAMHHKFQQLLARVGGHIDGIFFCPHGPEDNCDCRKPLPGLLSQIGQRFGSNLKNVIMIGDNNGDLDAAIAAGVKPILVLTGKGQRVVDSDRDLRDIPIYRDLSEAVDEILKQEKEA